MNNAAPGLERFVEAQAPVYAAVTAELRAGHKRTHWMWFVFPQIAGLGHSPMAVHYAIASLDEAARYLAHPVLGPRLRECTALMLTHRDKSARAILGSPDDLKFRSSLTLFSRATTDNAVFLQGLEAFYEGQGDAATLARCDPPPS